MPSKPPEKQPPKKQPPKTSINGKNRQATLANPLSRFLAKWWKAPGIVIGAGATVLAYSVLIPDVTLSVYNTREPTQPMETHFLISNNNPILSIYKVRYNCQLSKMQAPQGPLNVLQYSRAGLDQIEIISSKGTYSIYCGGFLAGQYREQFIPKEILTALNRAVLKIDLHFQPLFFWPWWVTEKSFVFSLTRDTQNNAQWLPVSP
jgi:hypothetical protein